MDSAFIAVVRILKIMVENGDGALCASSTFSHVSTIQLSLIIIINCNDTLDFYECLSVISHEYPKNHLTYYSVMK